MRRAVHAATGSETGSDGHVVAPVDERLDYAVSGADGTIDIDEVRRRHPERVIRRNGHTWEAVDPTGFLPPVESGRLDFLDAMLGTGEAG